MTADIHHTVEALVLARQIASYARSRGFDEVADHCRPASNHLGAALADSILQAGLNYDTVVRARVERIVKLFPQAACMSGIVAIIRQGATSDFLMWKHPTKIGRFIDLALLLQENGVTEAAELRHWLQKKSSRGKLLGISGVGPKTVDYLACLVGVDCIPIDRHVRMFAQDAGVRVENYDSLKLAFSYAADLLEISRRNFDRWIWQTARQFSA